MGCTCNAPRAIVDTSQTIRPRVPGACDCFCGGPPYTPTPREPFMPVSGVFTLGCNSVGLALPSAECSCPPTITGVSAVVRRRGTAAWTMRYPAWDVDENLALIFRFDDALTGLKPGRYDFEVRHGTAPCARFEMILTKACPVSTGGSPRLLAGVAQPCLSPTPSGVHPVFTPFVGLRYDLSAILERGVDILPLCEADRLALCAKLLYKPVELQVFDGLNTETVMFSGCESGIVRVVRGNPQYRFPKGACVSFVWTQNNVVNAMTPCP
jgi:hypothetical protein